MLLLESVGKGTNSTDGSGRILTDLNRELEVMELQVCGVCFYAHWDLECKSGV